jgi:hypothetical protein
MNRLDPVAVAEHIDGYRMVLLPRAAGRRRGWPYERQPPDRL